MALSDITAPAIEAALREFDSLGSERFLAKYGYGDAKRYRINWNGRNYPSKAIVGAAHGKISGNKPLTPYDFTGGEKRVATLVRKLGFTVVISERNPIWTRDEIILALALYMENPSSPPGKTSGKIADLSKVLNDLHRLDGVDASPTLRNANGVYLKLMNLRALDPIFQAQGKVGMQAGGALEKEIWTEYAGRLEKLASDAKEIRNAIERASEAQEDGIPLAEPYEGEEGGIIIRQHKRYERDPKLIAEKRKEAENLGKMHCEVCGFDFKTAYGDLGAGYIEVHHLKPVHTMKSGSKTKLSDLALLCANCHRMAHRKRVPLSIAELKTALEG